MKKIRHAIIGCGRVAKNHVNACRVNNIDVVYGCDIDISKGQSFCRENRIKNFTSNYMELAELTDVDSVSICTDHASHIDIAKIFLGKKHIVIEKPLAISVENIGELYHANETVITVIAQHRFDYLVNFVKKVILNNDLGKVCLVNAHLQCYRDNEYYSGSGWRGTFAKEGGSTVINQAYHIVDTLIYLFGKPQKIASFKECLKYKGIIETEDTCVAIFKYPDMLATFSSTNSAIMDWSTNIEIIGTKGSIAFTIDFPENITEMYVDDNFKEKYCNELAQVKKNYVNNINSAVNYYGLSHNLQFKNFKEAILYKDDVKVTVQKAADTLSVIEEIYRNAEI